MSETTEVRLARIEEKIDGLHDKQDASHSNQQDQEKRLRSLEHHRSWLWGAWAGILALFQFKNPA